ncbi:MAG TPA: MOSC domain-containing protein, partial [Alphaproteobacteria bacterium]|nr:MOSC domain-containing protein [Alphaproteobacteria bacterium]
PFDHYPVWREGLPQAAELLSGPGAFGENLSSTGLTEQEVCVGDVFALGTARLQVSQARQPCWKLGCRFGDPAMPRLVQDSGRTGWYYRVLDPGVAAAGDRLILRDRPNPDWTLARVLHVLYHDCLNRPALAAIAGLEDLAVGWRRLAQRRLDSMTVEDWGARLLGSG